MKVIGQSCALLLWMHTLTFVKCQDCTHEAFRNSPLFDASFDTTGMEDEYQNKQQVRVSCAVGHTGFFGLLCNDGVWQFRGTKCHPIRCPVINVEDNVEVIGDPEEANFGNVLRFGCKNRHEILIGSAEMSCDENGDWSSPPPKCEVVKCTVPAIANGFVTGRVQEYKEDEILSYECNLNYKRAEGRPSVCTKSGIRAEWSPRPACELIRCRVTLPPIRGTSYQPSQITIFSVGATLTVTCEDSYWISTPKQTSAVSTCKSDGKWTIRPVCQEVTCPNEMHGSVLRWDIHWRQRVRMGTLVDFTCRSGFRRTDGASQVKCTRDGWIPNPPCQEITCNSNDIRSANIDGDKQIYRNYETAHFTCKGSQDQFSLTCSADGWRGNVYCRGHQCKQLELSNANVIRNQKAFYDQGDRVQYACANDADRRFTVKCDFDGWTGIQNCSACLQPDVLHGFAVRPAEDTLYYTCDEGYKLSTKGWWGQAKCIDGLWYGLEQCVESNKCREIPAIANAKIKHERQRHGEVDSLQIICRNGYQSQIERLLCVDGKWDSNGLPFNSICTLVAGTCSPPPKVENAVILTAFQREYLSDSKVTFKCRENFMMEGTDTITCQNSQWDMGDIKCSPYCSKPRTVDQIMTFGDNKEKYSNGEVIEYHCRQPSEKSGGSATCVDGQWNEAIRCGVKPCPLPESIPNGYYEIVQGDDFVFGATIKYFCNVGYQMVSKIDTRTCLLDKWTNHVPICEPLRCEQPPAQRGITINGLPDNEEGVLPDRYLTFSCDLPGKQLSGSPLVICGRDGVWDKPFPSCEDIACKVGALHPQLTAHGLQPGIQTIEIGHKLRFRCGDDYTLDGSEDIECLPSGQWNNPFPTCAEPCQLTGIPNSVRLSTHVRDTQVQKGQKLKFYCPLRSQLLQGKAEVECLSNGQWSNPFPTCGAPLQCERPPHLAGGDTAVSTKFSYNHNDKVKYICQNYYVMKGGPEKTCSNGQWLGDITCLKPCTVNRELMSMYNIAFRYTRDDKLYSAHDDEIEFRCTPGKRHNGALNMRQKCIDGAMELPTCQ
nr:complement factor H-like isoform X3 [Syngnathus scovelli]